MQHRVGTRSQRAYASWKLTSELAETYVKRRRSICVSARANATGKSAVDAFERTTPWLETHLSLRKPIWEIATHYRLRVCSAEFRRLKTTAELSCILRYFAYSYSMDLVRSAISFSSVGRVSVALSSGSAPTPDWRKASTSSRKEPLSSVIYAFHRWIGCDQIQLVESRVAGRTCRGEPPRPVRLFAGRSNGVTVRRRALEGSSPTSQPTHSARDFECGPPVDARGACCVGRLLAN